MDRLLRERSSGILYKPEGNLIEEEVPMILLFYETLSDVLLTHSGAHTSLVPSIPMSVVATCSAPIFSILPATGN